MADGTKIEWTNATWQIITGCDIVSPGCTNCYAMKLAGTRLKHISTRAGLTKPSRSGPVWTGEVRFNEELLYEPLRWRRPRYVFPAAHGDMFHKKVKTNWLDRIFAVMALSPRHTYQCLTKRSDVVQRYLDDPKTYERVNFEVGRMFEDAPISKQEKWNIQRRLSAWHPIITKWPLPNVWIGVSVEDKARMHRIEDLRQTPAAVRFLSLEPLLEDLGELDLTGIDWVICGGESQSGARPMHPNWARSIRDQCIKAGVAFHFKQHGSWAPVPEISSRHGTHAIFPDGKVVLTHTLYNQGRYIGPEDQSWVTVNKVGKKAAGRTLDGRTWDEMPEKRTTT